jgi:PAS domain S-box-containing protein
MPYRTLDDRIDGVVITFTDITVAKKTPMKKTTLRRRAEASLPPRSRKHPAGEGGPKAAADTQRLLHVLQVHQIELELQNAELQEARNRSDVLIEKYTDLYDFAPVGYFSLDETGRILEANLTGAAMLGDERSRLISRSLSRFVAPPSRPDFLDFLAKVFADTTKQVCEAKLLKKDGTSFWASLHGDFRASPGGRKDVCWLVVSDITALREAQAAQRLLEAVSASNAELKQEIVRRQAVEETLRQSEAHQRELLELSHRMQAQVRAVSHRLILAREDERKRISRDLHDDISQTLASINVRLENLAREPTLNPRVLRRKISRTQRVVEKSVAIVHRFAVELRPTSLDDLGLIVTLRALLNGFMKRTGIRVHFTTFAAVDTLNSRQRTMLYRIIQAALDNVAKHAEASRVTVILRQHADTVQLEIFDDGKAFDVERVMRIKGGRHLGLIDMRERAELLGGTFKIESKPGLGTTLHAQIPLRQRRPSQGSRMAKQDVGDPHVSV